MIIDIYLLKKNVFYLLKTVHSIKRIPYRINKI